MPGYLFGGQALEWMLNAVDADDATLCSPPPPWKTAGGCVVRFAAENGEAASAWCGEPPRKLCLRSAFLRLLLWSAQLRGGACRPSAQAGSPVLFSLLFRRVRAALSPIEGELGGSPFLL